MNTLPIVMTTFVLFFALMVLGLPVAFALFGAAVFSLVFFFDPKMFYIIYSNTFKVLTFEGFLAVPLFIIMATFLLYSGIGTRLYDMMYKWFAGLRGGLAIGTVVLCTLIAAITGQGATGVVTVGSLALPEMERRGYSRSISVGCIPAAGALGPIIPPSVIMIIVGIFGGISIGKLFMGGILPGLLMSLLMILYIVLRCWLKPSLAPAIPIGERATWSEKMISLRGVIIPIGLIILVLGAIYSGLATPTEAGGVGAFGTLISAAIYRQLNLGMLKQASISALQINALVMWIIIGGMSFSTILALSGITRVVSDFVTGLEVSSIVILIVMMIIPFIMGMFMDATPIIMVCIPIFMPIVRNLGVDDLWFALLFSINVVIGYVTPPFGYNLFYMRGIAPHISMGQIYRSVIPFAIIMTVVLILLIIWPPLGLWLPSMMK